MPLQHRVSGQNVDLDDQKKQAIRDGIGASAADHSHAGLMTPAERNKLGSLPSSTALSAALAAKADLVGGKLRTDQVPDIALQQYLGAVASQAAMLALAGQSGDWCSRTDTGTDWRIVGDPTTLAGWLQTSYPSAPVSSVNGKTGAVTLTPADIPGLGPLAGMSLPEAQAAVSGPWVSRHTATGGAVQRACGAFTESADVSDLQRMFTDVRRVPGKIAGFRLGFEFISSLAHPPVTLARYALTGVAGNSAVASMDAAAQYSAALAMDITFQSAAGFTPAARRSQKRPSKIYWSDFIPCAAEEGQTIVSRFLVPNPNQTTPVAWRYTYCPHGIASRANYLAAVANPVMWNSVAADWLTGNNNWGVNSTNMQVGAFVPYFEWIFANDTNVSSVWVYGDSTAVGTTGVGTTDAAVSPVIQACQQVSADTGKIVIPVVGAVGGTTTWDSYIRMSDMIEDIDVHPSAVIWHVGSQNNNSVTTTDTIQRGLLLRVAQMCAQHGIRLILQTQIPLNGATLEIDAARKSLNDFARAICSSGRATLADWDAVVTDGGTPAAYKPIYGNLSHPTAAAYDTYAATALKPAIRAALGI